VVHKKCATYLNSSVKHWPILFNSFWKFGDSPNVSYSVPFV